MECRRQAIGQSGDSVNVEKMTTGTSLTVEELSKGSLAADPSLLSTFFEELNKRVVAQDDIEHAIGLKGNIVLSRSAT